MPALWRQPLYAPLLQPFKLERAFVSSINSQNSIKNQSSLILAQFEINGEYYPVIVDTGASISIIPERGSIMKSLSSQIKPANMNVDCGGFGLTHIDKKINIATRPRYWYDNPVALNYYVMNGREKVIGYDALLGLDTLKRFNLIIEFLNGKSQMYCNGKLISLDGHIDRPVSGFVRVDERFLSATNDDDIGSLLKKYKSVFTDISSEPLRGKPMRILTTHNRPIFAKQRHYNADEIIAMKAHIESLLEKGIIEHTYSGYAATSRIIPKRNGTGRLVVNYIPLNSVTLRDSYVLPHISDILTVLEGNRYFTTADCAQGFYQILIDQRDRHKTAFSTPIGNFQFVRCPFGARNSCAAFQSEMNRIFSDGLYTRCVIYVDDILIFGKTRSEHDENLEWVLSRCKQFNVKLKLEKCHFAQTEVKYLGFNISGRYISPLKERVETLNKDKPPRDKTELRSTIGKLNFYSRFIPRYSSLLEPLRELFKKNRDFQWRANHQKVYEQLIDALNNAPPQLMTPRSTDKTIEILVMKNSLETILVNEDNQLICRASRFLTQSEVNYSLVEKQLLALTVALQKFRVWIDPEHVKIKVPSIAIERAFKLVDRPDRIENLLLRMPAGFDNFQFIVEKSLSNVVQSKYQSHIPEEIFYVDGACRHNGKPDCVATWGVVAEYDRDLAISGFVEKDQSNQSAELTAAIKACEYARDNGMKEITIVTDSRYLHSAATNWIDKWMTNDWKDFKNKQVVNKDLFSRLLEVKSGIQIEWIHVRGHSDTEGNIRADNLARSLLDPQAEQLCALVTCKHRVQQDDPEIEEIKIQLINGERNDLVLEDGQVYYVDPKIETGDPRRIYVPRLARPWLLELAHDNQVYGGHLGIKKTFSKITRFWWPGMLRDVELYVKSCHICQAFKNRTGLTPGFLHNIPVSQIFEHLHVDIIGPTIASTIRGSKYIVTATDAFSKVAFAQAKQSVKTQDVIDFIEDCIISIHGKPKTVITDRGSQFISSEWKDFMKKHSIEHQLTSPYHPQSNGIDERLNGTLVRILKSYVDKYQQDWDVQLKWALYVYNTTVHSSTGFSPYHIMHGFDPRSPFNEHLTVDNEDNKNLEETRRTIRAKANELNLQSQANQKKNYDKLRGSATFNIGQLVLVREFTCPSELSKKFYPKWSGPNVVISIMGDKNNPRALKVLNCENLVERVVAIRDIKPYESRPAHLTRPNSVTEQRTGINDQDLDSSRYYLELEQTDKIPNVVDVPTLPDRIGGNHEENQQSNVKDPHNESNSSDCSFFSTKGTPGLDFITSDCITAPFSSSPKKRVTIGGVDTFCYNPTDILDKNSIVDIEEDVEHSTYRRHESENRESPEQPINPYVMRFIIDNPTTDPTFEPDKTTLVDTSEDLSTRHDENESDLSVHSNNEADELVKMPRYPLRRTRQRVLRENLQTSGREIPIAPLTKTVDSPEADSNSNRIESDDSCRLRATPRVNKQDETAINATSEDSPNQSQTELENSEDTLVAVDADENEENENLIDTDDNISIESD